MSLTTALYTGQSGLKVNSTFIDVIGNNIANSNTVGFKGSRAFSTSQFNRTYSLGTGPNSTSGGINPTQVGLGTMLNSVQRNTQVGTIQPTGINTDMAIEGKGYFLVDQNGQQRFTRAGHFQLDENQNLTLNGGILQGFDRDSNFNIVQGSLVDLTIPLGTLTLAQETQNAEFDGNLNADGELPTTGSVYTTRAFYQDPALATANTAGSGYDLSVAGNDLYIADATGNPIPTPAVRGGTDTVVTLQNLELGGKVLPTVSFAFTSATDIETFNTANNVGVNGVGQTMDDFVEFIQEAMGISEQTITVDGVNYSLDGDVSIQADGTILIEGNEGRTQDLNLSSAGFVFEELNPGNPGVTPGGNISNPFIPTRNTGAVADGESLRTTFEVYDSLGTPISVDLTFVMQDKIAEPDGAGTRWMWVAQVDDNQYREDNIFGNEFNGARRIVGSGVATFDGFGRLVPNETTPTEFEIFRRNGADSPTRVLMDFDNGTDGITALTDTRADIAMISQDGFPIGTLADFSIGQTGIINGAFTNGMVKDMGQITLATFTNDAGLVEEGSNLFSTGSNSGEPIIVTPTAFGVGRIIGGALEQSNVDISTEFTELINASTGFSANSRVITTSDRLLQELLQIVR